MFTRERVEGRDQRFSFEFRFTRTLSRLVLLIRLDVARFFDTAVDVLSRLMLFGRPLHVARPKKLEVI